MINNRVVLVLGAGASMPYDFPSGAQLKADVVEMGTIHDNDPFRRTFPPGVFNDRLFASFQQDLANSPLTSIDALLEARPDYLSIGKHTIAYMLVRKEDPNRFQSGNISAARDWYRYLFELMLDEGLDRLPNNELAAVTFNYDRSFEFYFVNGLMSTFGLSYHDAREHMSFLEVIHVHGQLGKLEKSAVTQDGRPYNAKADSQRVQVAAQGIKIISELSPDPTSDDWSGFRRAWHQLEQAKSIVFIGFGYNRNNVLRLMNCNVAR